MTNQYTKGIDLPIPPIERLMARVQLVSCEGFDTDCWVPTYALNRQGYTRIVYPDGTPHQSHRVAYEALVGPIPDGLQLDHLCRNRACCNPAHLEPVTAGENLRRGMHPNMVTYRTNVCRNGHSMDDALWDGKGRRCRICRRAEKRRNAARLKAERIYGPLPAIRVRGWDDDELHDRADDIGDELADREGL